MTRVIPCPTCGNDVRWDASSEYRPFCSERCRLIDFGEWASERHRLPGDSEYDDIATDDEGAGRPPGLGPVEE